MEKSKYDVFISYRRDGGDKYARTIQQALEKQYRVFLDFDELEDGVFDQRIIDAISESPVFLLILSKGALDRCVDKKDWVRQEIMQAVESGCHIVPVTIIGDNFNGLPPELPEELRRAVGSHQFSQLHMETLFKESMAKLVKTRIAPYINKEQNATGAEIHIETDADCQLFHFHKLLAMIYAGKDNVVRIKRGKHKLEFVSVEFEDIKYQQILEIPDEDYTDFVEVKMKERIDDRKGEEERVKRKPAEVQELKMQKYKVLTRISAGTNIGLVRICNEDNFLVCSDVSTSNWLIPMAGDYVDLGDMGALLVVADGENDTDGRASAIAVETVQHKFAPETLKWIVSDSGTIQRFMIDVLKTADLNIYDYCQKNKLDKHTYASIIMAYVLGTKLYVCWCGNCRCYISNKRSGIIQVSKDHTYAQELVDKGVIMPDQAYNHPSSNRITRCLGDNEKRAQPESLVYELHDDDFIMVCSDGLYNLVKDKEIHSIINKNQDSIMDCKNELISTALANGGNDNVTLALIKIKMKEI